MRAAANSRLILAGGALFWLVAAAAAEPVWPERRLQALAADSLDSREQLQRAALILLEADWRADSLRIEDGSVVAVNPCPLDLVLSVPRQGRETLPWPEPKENSALAAREAADHWLADMDAAGYPFAQVWFAPGAEGGEVSVSLVAGPSGPPGQVEFHGLRRLRSGFLKEHLDLPTDSALTLAAAQRGRRRLAATGWFTSIDRPRLFWNPSTGRVGVLYDLDENPRASHVSALVGGGGGAVRAHLDLALFSPFGGGRRWHFFGSRLGEEQDEVLVELREPRLLGRNLAAETTLSRSRRDSTYLSQSAHLDLLWPLPGGWRAETGLGFERVLFPQTESELSRRSQSLGLTWQDLGRVWLGKRSLSARANILERRSDTLENLRQLHGELRLAWAFDLAGALRLDLRGGGQWLTGGAGPYSVAELFALGGATTLRGYDEEHFLGDRIAHGAIELALGTGLELSLFVDYGQGSRRGQLSDQRFNGLGLGMGLRAPAKAGDLKMALALAKGAPISDLRIHVSLDTGF